MFFYEYIKELYYFMLVPKYPLPFYSSFVLIGCICIIFIVLVILFINFIIIVFFICNIVFSLLCTCKDNAQSLNFKTKTLTTSQACYLL